MDELIDFTATLFQPFGFERDPFSMRQYIRRVGKVKIYKNHTVHLTDVMICLSAAFHARKMKWSPNADFSTAPDDTVHADPNEKKKKKKGKVKGTGESERTQQHIASDESRKFADSVYLCDLDSNPLTMFDIHSIIKIQREWRRRMARREEDEEGENEEGENEEGEKFPENF
jgi:thiamine pyrophosphate-dependent acetolactate synthase large subunit-like protein